MSWTCNLELLLIALQSPEQWGVSSYCAWLSVCFLFWCISFGLFVQGGGGVFWLGTRSQNGVVFLYHINVLYFLEHLIWKHFPNSDGFGSLPSLSHLCNLWYFIVHQAFWYVSAIVGAVVERVKFTLSFVKYCGAAQEVDHSRIWSENFTGSVWLRSEKFNTQQNPWGLESGSFNWATWGEFNIVNKYMHSRLQGKHMHLYLPAWNRPQGSVFLVSG